MIYTDINRDGTNKVQILIKLKSCQYIKLSCDYIWWIINKDIKKAKTLKNIEGIIVGKAIYDGDIKLDDLVKEDA